MIAPSLSSVSLPASHMVVVRTDNENEPLFWTCDSSLSDAFPEILTLKLRGQITSLGEELGRCEPRNSRQP